MPDVSLLISHEFESIIIILRNYVFIFAFLVDEFRMKLARTEQEMNELRINKSELSRSVEYERNRNQAREKKIDELEFSVEKLKRELNERDLLVKDLQEQNSQKDRMLREMETDQQRQKRRFESKLAHETEKTSRQIAKEFREKQELLNVSYNFMVLKSLFFTDFNY